MTLAWISFHTVLKFINLRWLGTIHVWLHHENLNTCFSKSSTKRLLEGVSIYKAFDKISSPANKSVQLWVKRELEIEGV